MNLCSKCKKNVAVIFVTKFENGKKTNEGLCLPCAKAMGIADLPDLQSAMSDIDPEIMTNLESQLSAMEGDSAGDADDNILGSIFAGMSGNEEKDSKNGRHKEKKKKKKFVDSYGVNLTAKAREGNVDRVIGREEEITRTIEILNRRTKNNPCLIGEPGVGKTAIAEGLAARIAEGLVPEKLLKKEIYLLDFTALVAGTQFRGQFEQRLKSLLDEVKEQGNIILVIDELHNIVGAGEAEGAMSAANILKPALSRGEIQVIGATTIDEYRRYIEKDSALERRFQPIIVEEPSVDETVKIIMGIKGYYEEYHKVIISEKVARCAATLSERYITDRFLPDKAIDLIDEAASKANLMNKKITEIAKLQNLLFEKNKELEALTPDDYERAANLKTEICVIEEDIKKASDGKLATELTEEDVAAVVERWTKIPARKITMQESERLLSLEETLKKRVKGQDEAIGLLAGAIRRSRAGLSLKKRPASFIFAGGTGTGKTELALALTEAMFDSEDSIIRLDMSEYMEKHTASKIIGSPPGYVGYDDGGQLTEKVRRKPYSVILFDEIEKAHPDVMNVLLQILEDGKITDSHGRRVSFENTVIIMTTNAGSKFRSVTPGYLSDTGRANRDKVKSALEEFFRPEFLNRVDEIIVFNILEKEVLRQILKKMLNEVITKLKERNIELSVTERAENLLLDKGNDPANGARPLRRVIEKQLENKVAEMLIKGEISNNSKILADTEDDINLKVNLM